MGEEVVAVVRSDARVLSQNASAGVGLRPATLRIMGKHGRRLITANEVELACLRRRLTEVIDVCMSRERGCLWWNYV